MSVSINELTNIDYMILRYVNKPDFTPKNNIVKRFPDSKYSTLRRIEMLSEVSYRPVAGSQERILGYLEEEQGAYRISGKGKIALQNFEVAEREKWLKFWLPIAVSIALSVSALMVSVFRC